METTAVGNSWGQARVTDGRLLVKTITTRQHAQKFKNSILFISRIETFIDLAVIYASCDISALRVILPCGRNFSTFALRASFIAADSY